MPRREAERIGVVRALIEALNDAFAALGASVPPSAVENMVSLVHSCMGGAGRFYHRTAHVFDLFSSAKQEPTTALAAIFHDIVYVQIDGLLPSVRTLLQPFIEQTEKGFKVGKTTDKSVQLVNHFFGFKEGQDLPPFGGQNEYLSCLVAVLLIRDYVSMDALVAVIIAIEGTVPFRGSGTDGLGWAERARQRYLASGPLLGGQPLMSEAALDKYVQNAVLMSNRDVAGFGADDIRVFLANTWNLLPESNPSLRVAGLFPLADYRTAVWKSEKFLSTLNCDNITHQYDGLPAKDEFERRRANARQNIRITLLFLRYKLMGMGLVEAVASETGGCEGPSMLYLGDLSNGPRFDQFLPKLTARSGELSGDERVVADLLREGSGMMASVDVAFDLDASPVAAFVQNGVPAAQLTALFDKTRQFFEKEVKAAELLRAFPREVVTGLANALASTLPTRQAAVQTLLSAL